MKKILIIEPSGKLYGSEMVLHDILRNISREKYDFTIALPKNSLFSQRLDEISIRHKSILTISSLKAKLISYFKIFSNLLFNKTDLIFINQAGILRPISLINKCFNIPIVCEVSTLEDAIWVNALKQKHFKQVKSFICNSEFIADKLQVSPEKKSTLYYGYQHKNLNPVIRSETSPFNIVLLGRISVSKGHFLLVDAIHELAQRGTTQVMVYFVGDAPSQEIENEIRAKIDQYQLNDYFVFRGFQTNISEELSNKNLMVIPSVQEPFGRIFCETAEAKLPTIVANSGGLGELASKFNIGIQFKGNNSNDLADKIMFSIDHFKEIKNDFETKAEEMLQKLDMSSYIKEIEDILDDAIQGKKNNNEWYGDALK